MFSDCSENFIRCKMTLIINCSCDPLKKILQRFLLDALKRNEYGDDVGNKLHLFYKSAVLRTRPGTQSGKSLDCRIGEDTLKTLQEWAKDIGAEVKVDDKINCEGVERVELDKFGNVTLKLDLNGLKRKTIGWWISKGWQGYSTDHCHNQIYRVEIAMASGGSDCITEYRKLLAAQAVTTILGKIGHQIDAGHFTNLKIDSKISNLILVAAMPVGKNMSASNNSLAFTPEAVLRMHVGNATSDPCGVQDLLSKRLAEIKEIGEARRLEGLQLSSWTTSLDNLTRATLHYDLLYRPVESDVQIGSLAESGQMNNNALFIMYNYSRILSILRKFSEQVESGEYPSLPSFDDIDFNRICEREEERYLLQLVMEWPRIMESAVNFIRYQLNLVDICKFMLSLAKAFNNFYFQVVVLVPCNASHNFPGMMARVYLLKAVCSVFEDCLDILQVNHANSI